MHPRNLAKVMAPNIMFKKPEEDYAKYALAMKEDIGPTIEIIAKLIEEMEFFFLEKEKDDESVKEITIE